MEGDSTLHLPPSRELRQTEYERIAFSIYSGDAGELAAQLVRLEVTIERDRELAVHKMADYLRERLKGLGSIVVEDVDEIEQRWYEEDILGL